MGIQHRRVVGKILVVVQRGAYRQFLHVDVGAVERGQMRRQWPNVDWLDAVFVYQAGHLDAAPLGQIINKPVVQDVPVEHESLPCVVRPDDA